MKTLSKIWLPMLALLGLLAGCSSDPVAPQDTLPPATAEDAAFQAGMVAYAVTAVGPEIMQAANPAKEVRNIVFDGDRGLTGAVHLDYRMGPDGVPAVAGEATWVRLFTASGTPVVYTVPELGGQTAFDLDVMATLDHQADQATILQGSGGTMTSGDTVVTFTMLGIVVGSAGYPQAGGLTVTSGTHSAEVMFNGSNVVTMTVDSSATYFIDLDTGEVTTGVPI